MTEEQKEGWEQWKKEVEDAEGYCFMPMHLEDGTVIGINDPRSRYMDFFLEEK